MPRSSIPVGLARDGRAVPPQLRALRLKPETWRVVDRVGGRERKMTLKPVGRPSCIYSDALVTLSAVGAMRR